MRDCPKVWLENEHGIQVISMTDVNLAEALKVMRSSFYTDEPVSIGFRLQETPQAIDELEQLTLETYKDGVSLVAMKNKVMMGCLFNKIQQKPKQGDVSYFEFFKNEKCETDQAKEYMELMIQLDERSDPFSHYGVDSLLETMFLVTARHARKQGVGLALINASSLVAQDRGLPVLSAIYSNKGSQRIGYKLNWDLLTTANMSEFSFRGQPISEFTGENQFLHIMAKKV